MLYSNSSSDVDIGSVRLVVCMRNAMYKFLEVGELRHSQPEPHQTFESHKVGLSQPQIPT
jgi:hypothetical protein